jgi:hypothetical protein
MVFEICSKIFLTFSNKRNYENSFTGSRVVSCLRTGELSKVDGLSVGLRTGQKSNIDVNIQIDSLKRTVSLLQKLNCEAYFCI